MNEAVAASTKMFVNPGEETSRKVGSLTTTTTEATMVDSDTTTSEFHNGETSSESGTATSMTVEPKIQDTKFYFKSVT